MRPAALSTAFAVLLLAVPAARNTAQTPPPRSRKVVDIVDTLGCYGIAEPKSGRFVVYADPRGIHVIDERSGRETAAISHTTAPVVGSYYMSSSLSISASGRRLVFLASAETKDAPHVWSVDLDTVTGAPVGPPHRVSIMPADGVGISDDGRWITLATSDPSGSDAAPQRRLVVMPSDGGDERTLDRAGNIQTPRWSPDGKTIYYIRFRGRGAAVARISVAGGAPDSLASGISIIGVSADGTRIAYLPPFDAPMRVIDPEGHPIGPVLSGHNDWFLTWSRHEPGTVFSRRGEWPSAMKVIALDNGQVSPFPLNQVGAPRFSPDGRRLAVMASVDGRGQIVVYDMASRRQRVIRTAVEPVSEAPDGPSMQWSPDGSHIAFLALDSSFQRHDLYAVDVATSRSVRLADFGPQRWANLTLFHWRSDSKAIDYITMAWSPSATATLERVTLSGDHSVISRLPAFQRNFGPNGYRFINDSLIAVGRNPRGNEGDTTSLSIVDARTGVTKALIGKAANWQISDNSSILSPDGKWIAFGTKGQKDGQGYVAWAIASVDGQSVRELAQPTVRSCSADNQAYAAPHQWLPDSRALIGYALSCGERGKVYVVPIDGSAARHLPIPSNWDADLSVMPDGRSVLASTITSGSMSIFAVDVASSLPGRAQQAGKPRKPGTN